MGLLSAALGLFAPRDVRAMRICDGLVVIEETLACRVCKLSSTSVCVVVSVVSVSISAVVIHVIVRRSTRIDLVLVLRLVLRLFTLSSQPHRVEDRSLSPESRRRSRFQGSNHCYHLLDFEKREFEVFGESPLLLR